MRLFHRSLATALVLTSVFGAGCAAESEEAESSEDAVSVNFRTVWADLKDLKGDGWSRAAGDALSENVQRGLSTDAVNLSWDVKAVGGKQHQNELFPGLNVYGLDTIQTGLLQRFGEKDLTTDVNRLRLAKVQDGSYYLDATTQVGLNAARSWSIGAPDLGPNGAQITVGFDANASLESRVVLHAPKNSAQAQAKAWLQNLVSQRDYVMSKKAESVEQMQPGEMWGLRGKGRLGANLGVGIPIVVGNPLNIIVSAAGAATLEGMLDVQVIRLDGKEVVVDLGIEQGKLASWALNVGSSYGVPSICRDSATGQNGACLPTVAGIDLREEVPKRVQSALNSYLGFNVTTGGSRGNQRLSVLRLRFDFAAAGADADEVKAAFTRAVQFDARHAQTLYYQRVGTPGAKAVVVEADLFKAMSSSTRYTNWNAFGFSIYEQSTSSASGVIAMKTPTETKVVSFDTKNTRKGWFETRHGFERTGIASIASDGKSNANLVLNLATADKHLDARGLITDNADAVLLTTVGMAGVKALDAYGNALQSKIVACGPTNRSCILEALGGSKEAFEAKKEAEVARLPFPAGLSDDYKELAKEAGRIRLTTQALAFSGDVLQGPAVDFTFGMRLDEAGLNQLIAPGNEQLLKDKAYAYLAATTTVSNREELVSAGLTREDLEKHFRGAFAGDGRANNCSWPNFTGPQLLNDSCKWPVFKELVDELGREFAKASASYVRISQSEKDVKSAMQAFDGRYVPVFVGLSFGSVKSAFETLEDRQTAAEEVAFRSANHEKAMVGARLVDRLYDKANRGITNWTAMRNTHLWAEHLVGYSLAQMVPPSMRETSLDFRVSGNIPEQFEVGGVRRWATAKPITAGKIEKVTLGSLDLAAVAR